MIRFWSKVEIAGPMDCWEWQAYKTKQGYGQFGLNGKIQRAHRVAYELVVGTIPNGLTIDHLCRNTGCVNPFHLEPVTLAENIRRGNRYNVKTHCKRGHERTTGNLKGSNCKTCTREWNNTESEKGNNKRRCRRYYEKNKEEINAKRQIASCV